MQVKIPCRKGNTCMWAGDQIKVPLVTWARTSQNIDSELFRTMVDFKFMLIYKIYLSNVKSNVINK